MKDKFTLKVLIIGLVALGIGIVSFIFFDLSTIRELQRKDILWDSRAEEDILDRRNKSNGKNENLLVNKVKINDTVKKLDIDIVNGNINIIEGDSFEYTIISDVKDLNMGEHLDIINDKKTLMIDEISRVTNGSNDILFNIDIIIPKDKKLDLNIEMVNGEILGEVDFNNISIDLVNGHIDFKGDNMCEMNIDSVDLELELSYKNYDNEFNITAVSGNVKFLDEIVDINPITGDDFERVLGNGKHRVDIDMVNGRIEVKN